MTNLGGLKLAEGGGTCRKLEMAEDGRAGGDGIEDSLGVVVSGAEVKTVIVHKVRV